MTRSTFTPGYHVAEMALEIGERRARLVWAAACDAYRADWQRDRFSSGALLYILYGDALTDEGPCEKAGRRWAARETHYGYGSI